jgi:hypothetical protein
MNPDTMLRTEFTKPKKPAICHIRQFLTGRGEDIRRDTRLYLKDSKGDSHHVADLVTSPNLIE